MLTETHKWGWKHVSVYGKLDRGSGTKRWKCNHCNQCYNGSYYRVRAHLLGFNGFGVKPCPAVDVSTRETLNRLENNLLPRNKLTKKISPCMNRKRWLRTGLLGFPRSTKCLTKEDVDEVVAKFFYMDAMNVNVVNSTHFREMVKAIGEFGPKYELPFKENLSSSFLKIEKLRLEKVMTLATESWSYTGCTILCVNRLDGALGCFCVNFFVANSRVVMFLKEVDIIVGGDDGPDNLFINELTNVIEEVGSSSVVQVITRLGGQASHVFESVLISKFPNLFWSHCASHSILLLMEEIAELDWMKDVVVNVEQINQSVSGFKKSYFCNNIDIPVHEFKDNVFKKFAPSYFSVNLMVKMKSFLCELVLKEEWKQWRLENNVSQEEVSSADFWNRAELMVNLYKPFLTLLSEMDVVKSVMGDVYNWRVISIEALRCTGLDQVLVNQLEMLVESKWDGLFSPLHGAAYILNPRYFGRGRSKNESLTRAWNVTIERFEGTTEARTRLREELDMYWREEGCFGEADAVECRDKMEALSWWDNFGFETPHLQSLAVKILSQIPSAGIMCEESWQLCDSMPCREAVQRSGFDAEQANDFVFVRNNLKLQSLKYGRMGC